MCYLNSGSSESNWTLFWWMTVRFSSMTTTFSCISKSTQAEVLKCPFQIWAVLFSTAVWGSGLQHYLKCVSHNGKIVLSSFCSSLQTIHVHINASPLSRFGEWNPHLCVINGNGRRSSLRTTEQRSESIFFQQPTLASRPCHNQWPCYLLRAEVEAQVERWAAGHAPRQNRCRAAVTWLPGTRATVTGTGKEMFFRKHFCNTI